MKNIERLLDTLEQEFTEPTGDQLILERDSSNNTWEAGLFDKDGNVLYHSDGSGRALRAKARSAYVAMDNLDRLVGEA